MLQDDPPAKTPNPLTPRITEAERREAARKRRLAEALRLNLRRRKGLEEPSRPDVQTDNPADRER